MSASPGVRGLRAAVFAAVCVLLAVGAHAAAVGETPSAGAQGLGFGAVFVAGWLLGGRERGLVAIGGGTLAAQGGLHAGFGAGERGGGGMPGMRMPVRYDAAHDTVVHRATVHQGALHHSTPHTLAAHVLAALLTSWWLRRGEVAVWGLLRWAGVLVPGLVAWWRGPVGVARSTSVVRRRWWLPEPCRVSLRHVVRRRGPPGAVLRLG
ncbi:hypothetical protein ACVNF4_32300 [Streptomyces sp. S6]